MSNFIKTQSKNVTTVGGRSDLSFDGVDFSEFDNRYRSLTNIAKVRVVSIDMNIINCRKAMMILNHIGICLSAIILILFNSIRNLSYVKLFYVIKVFFTVRTVGASSDGLDSTLTSVR